MKRKFTGIPFLIILFFLIAQNNLIAQFTFVHITDLHVADSYCAGSYDLDGEMFVQLRDELNNLNPKPVFIVATGDISHVGDSDNDGMYYAFTQHLYPDSLVNPGIGVFFIDSLQTIPIYFTPGNHDFRTGNVPPLSNEDLTVYKNLICSVSDYSVTCQNAVIICMNSGYDDLRPLWDDTNYMSPEGSGFTDNQCNWLRAILDSNSTKKKVITMHHPAVNEVGVWCDGSPFSGTILDNADGSIKYNRITFLDICDSNTVDIILTGHAHQNVVVNRYGNIVNENWTDSTRYIQTGAALHGCYRIISVDSSSVLVSNPISIPTTQKRFYSNNTSLNVYPNPFSYSAIIEIYTNNKINNFEFIMYNMLGTVVKRITHINTNKFEIKKKNLSQGIYFYKILNHDNIIGIGKIIIQ